MTAREYLDMLRRDQDSERCHACGSSEICQHRRAEARIAAVEDIPRYLTGRKPPGRARSPRIAGKAEMYWTGTKWQTLRKAG